MNWVKEQISDVVEHFNVDTTQGLTDQQVHSRQAQYGLNEFEEQKKDSLFKKILHHLLEIPTMVLLAASVIATIAAVMRMGDVARMVAEGYTDIPSLIPSWAKVVVILIIVVINVLLGLYQESKAEKALEALKKMTTFKTTVLRDGVKQIVDANQIVPGDIVELNTGDVITADGRLIDTSSLQVEEAALTGESEPVLKNHLAVITEDSVPMGDRINTVYSGCLVTGGRGTVLVTGTGMHTEMGKIANMLNTTEKLLTPLQRRLQQLAKRISVIALFAGLAMFIVGFVFWGREPLDMLILAVALGVAAVPETLPIIVTMILSYGVFNMVTKKTIIRKIPAIETIGNTSVICSDKTGTLTMNKMKIQRVWHMDHDPISVTEPFNANQKKLIGLLASCSNATIEVHDTGEEQVIGDPTEIAIIRLLHELGLDRVQAERDYPRIHELPFDSNRKRMTTVHRTEDGYIAVTKGAFDRIPVDWDKYPDMYKEATKIHDEMTDKALRVIAISVKKYQEKPADLSEEALESDHEFRGMVGMIDPPRPESKDAVDRAKLAGIKTVMITGDHKGTAVAIAKEIGIMQPGDTAVTGAELAAMDDTELISRVRGISVYARVSPEDKMRIVRAWSSHNAVIAMTGDGVNDAPALKAADVGVAMGITGTEVSKSASDMIITDDNFATIVDAISEGRTSYDNIRKTIQFLLGVNFAEIFVLLTGMLAFGLSTVTALQILIVNVVYDGIPGFFLAYEKPEPGVMKRKPLPKGTGVFANRVGLFIAIRAVTFSILIMTAFITGLLLSEGRLTGLEADSDAHRIAMTMAFMVLSYASVIDLFNTRTSLSIFKAGITTNRGAFWCVIGAVAFATFVALFNPVGQIFEVAPTFGDGALLGGTNWLIIIGLSLIQIIAVEIVKLVLRVRDRKKGLIA